MQMNAADLGIRSDANSIRALIIQQPSRSWRTFIGRSALSYYMLYIISTTKLVGQLT